MKAGNSDIGIYKNMVANPWAPMTLRIGVAGHRSLPIDQIQRLREEIHATYAEIYVLVRALSKEEVAISLYARDISPIIRIISSLAEGADRLCIEQEIIPFDHELACILPFLKEQYEQDFFPEVSVIDTQQGTVAEFNTLLQRIGYGDSAAQVIELDCNSTNRAEAYIQCGKLLVEHSDILIAVYDGDNSELNGTAGVVAAARQNGVPVIHISTLPHTERRLYRSNRFGREARIETFDAAALQAELCRILLFTDILEHTRADQPSGGEKRKHEILNRFARYGSHKNLLLISNNSVDFDNAGPIELKKKYENPVARIFDIFQQTIASPKKIAAESNSFPEDNIHTLPAEKQNALSEELAVPSLERYFAAYLRADRLANYYSKIHRSTFMLIYLSGAAALIAAVLALAFKDDHLIVSLFVMVELALLCVIYWFYRQDHHRGYHDEWLEYRCLAEFLRSMRYLSLLGRANPFTNFRDTEEYLGREVIGHSGGGRNWLYIYMETIVRWVGFNACRMDRRRKENLSDFINVTWLNGQIKYHSRNALAMQILGRFLGKCSFRLFQITVAVVVLKLIILGCEFAFERHFVPDGITLTFALGAAILPIIATTAFAIRNHAEFDISAQRSLTMRTFLTIKSNKLATGKSSFTSEQMSIALNQIASITIKEAADWLEIYEVKESEPS